MTATGYDPLMLDAGTRDLVEALWSAGFATTDSGDGSKAGVMEGAMAFEHVAVECSRGDALRLLEIVRRARPGQKWQLERTEIYATDAPVPRTVSLLSRMDGVPEALGFPQEGA